MLDNEDNLDCPFEVPCAPAKHRNPRPLSGYNHYNHTPRYLPIWEKSQIAKYLIFKHLATGGGKCNCFNGRYQEVHMQIIFFDACLLVVV